MNARILTVICWCLLISLVAQASTSATIRGRITFDHGGPAANLTVTIGKSYSFTDVNGAYILRDVPYGRQDLQISKNGLVLKRSNITVDKAEMQHDEEVPR